MTTYLRRPYPPELEEYLPDTETWGPEIAATFKTKLSLLYRHFGLEQGAPFSAEGLVLALAMTHLKGFQVKPKSRGRPVKVDQMVSDVVLFMEVMRERDAGGSKARAYRRLAKRWGKSEATLRKRFHDLISDTPAGQRMWKNFLACLASAEEANQK